jgi:hypothetical protein
MLTRYWFAFVQSESPSALNLGCGITAYDRSDAERMLHDTVFSIFAERVVAQVVENIDVTTLEKNHVLPNLGNPAVRGVWYPALP